MFNNKLNYGYKIKNKFLEYLIGYSNKVDDELIIEGLSHCKGSGSAALTYIIKLAFNIHRFPMWEDRHFTNKFYQNMGYVKLEKIFRNTDFLENLENMVDEIKDIYEYTQNILNEKYQNKEYISLKRNLGKEYAAILLQLKNNAIKQKRDYIEISTDILNSFTDDDNSYYRDAYIKINISKKDILYFDKVFEFGLMENSEFIVFNRNSTGLLKININDIFKSNNDFDEYKYNIKVNMFNTSYHFIDFSFNEYVCFEKPFKKLDFKKESFICKIIKRIC